MADDGFSPEMLDAYFATLARQSDGGAGGGTRWTPQMIEANAPELWRALADTGAVDSFRAALGRAGIDANLTLDEAMTPALREQVYMAEGRERARPRYRQALERAQHFGYEALRQRIEGLVETEAQQHARRAMRRNGGIGSDAVAAPPPARNVAPPLPVGIDYSAPRFSPISAIQPSNLRNLPASTGNGESVLGSIPQRAPMPPTLSGMENAPQRPIPSPAAMGFMPPQFPTAQGGAMPQSPQEAQALASEPNVYNALLEASGMGSASRSRQAFQEGRPLAGVGHAALTAAPYVGGAVVGRAADAIRSSPAVAGMLATAGGVGGLIGLSEPPPVEAQRARAPDPAIMQEQRELARGGFYDGPIDGIDAERTQAARKAAAQARERKLQQDRDFELQRAGSEAERERLRLQQQESKRLADEAERNAALVREGTARLNERQPTPWEKARPYVAPTVGAVMGLAERGGLGWLLGRQRRALNQRADELSRAMGQGDVPERVGRVNQFWAEGAPNSPPPFAFQSGRQPYPWSNDPAAVAPNQLFRSSGGPLQNYGPIGITGLTGGAEIGGGMYLLGPAQSRVDAARAEVNRPNGATPANVRNLQQAEEELEQAKWMIRMGLGHIGGGVMGEMKGRIVQNKTRPSAQAADTERGRLDMMLRGGRDLPPRAERIRRANPDDPRGDWVPRSEPNVPGVTSYVSPKGQNEVFLDAGGNWQRRLPDGRTQFIGGPPSRYRRISQAEPNLLAAYG